ncbi:hypothetical protein V2I68_22780 [Pseudomonas viridiflava]|uniref:Uncharacterized protein n=1 Tax=Pseudomonas viridiflava TaxID=33069 RepID=A0ABU7NDQ5_PSEVI|nr:hypothetical protein [Pseudomonas viridiflava]MBI6576853.1 hypothetical protein [Pseudomonas viridiflava]MBI6606438.1 hypothetical protein [Pseudomonas viridiflava]MBI6637480.1 hypothetical protein [Pseudomonas viridiflava]MBI6867453.1 hypothetical protein [Pseudomonas viridiflava]MEE3938385.1 hypothetical protein [Pseudomonas viridiflava]
MTSQPNDARVSRELLERALACATSTNTSNWSSRLCEDLRLALAQPADQQGEPDVVYQWRPVNKDSGEPWLSGAWHYCGEGEYHRMLNHPEAATFNYAVRRLSAEQPATAKVDEQEAFESVFPMPGSVMKFKGGYAATSFGAWDAHEYGQKWAGWLARAKLNGSQS